MDYLSASESSEKWGVSLRQVQRLLADRWIPDVNKYGRSWMRLADVETPGDPRRAELPLEDNLTNDLLYALISRDVETSRLAVQLWLEEEQQADKTCT